MRVNVIGYGTVGKAQEFLLKKLGHEVFVFDPYVFPDVKSPEKLRVWSVLIVGCLRMARPSLVIPLEGDVFQCAWMN